MSKVKVIFSESIQRYVIVDKNNTVLNSCNGYGYISIETATSVMNYYFIDNKEKVKKFKKKYPKVVKRLKELYTIHNEQIQNLTMYRNELFKILEKEFKQEFNYKTLYGIIFSK